MSKQQPIADTSSAELEYLRGAVDNLSRLSLERRALLFGAAAVAAGAISTRRPPRLRLPTSLRLWPNSAPRFRATSTASTSRTRWSRSISAAFSPASGRFSDDRPAAHKAGRDPLGLLGNALRRLEADPVGRGHRLPRGAREPRRQQSAQAHLFHRGHAPTSTLQSIRPRSSPSSTSFSIPSMPGSRSCGTISTITGTSIGTCISA